MWSAPQDQDSNYCPNQPWPQKLTMDLILLWLKKNKKFKPSKHKTVENLVILKDVLETTSKIKN